MGVILGETADAQQAVENTASLITINRPQLGPAQGQVAVGSAPRLVDGDMEGAVHRFGVIILPVDVHRRVHRVLVIIEMARCLPQLFPSDMGGIEDVVTALPMALAPVLLDGRPDPGALRMPEDEAASDVLVEAEEIQLGPEPAMVPFLGFLDQQKIIVEGFLRRERGPVDALKLLAALVAFPIGAGDGQELEMLDRPGRGQVRPQAEIDEIPLPVTGHGVAALFADELDLEGLSAVGEKLDGLGLGQGHFLDGDIRGGELAHFRFDRVQVLHAERLGAQKIVEKAVVHGRPDADLGAGKEIEDRVRQKMGGAVP